MGKTLKDGSSSKVKVLPSVREMQTNPRHREAFILYSVRDARATWEVWRELAVRLSEKRWLVRSSSDSSVMMDRGTMLDFYERYFVAFGEVLTDMERVGIKVNLQSLRDAEARAMDDRGQMERRFRTWAANYVDNAHLLNIGSTAQMQQFFFGHFKDRRRVKKGEGGGEEERLFTYEKTEEEFAEEMRVFLQDNKYALLTGEGLKRLLRERGLKLTGSKQELVQRLTAHDQQDNFEGLDHAALVDICLARGVSAEGASSDLKHRLNSDMQAAATRAEKEIKSADKETAGVAQPVKPKRTIEFSIRSLGLPPQDWTPTGGAQVTTAVLKSLAGHDLDLLAHPTPTLTPTPPIDATTETNDDNNSNNNDKLKQQHISPLPVYGKAYAMFQVGD